MSLSSRITELFSSPDSTTTDVAAKHSGAINTHNEAQQNESQWFGFTRKSQPLVKMAETATEPDDFEMKRPLYLHAMLAGGIGGTTGDAVMHSLDTVKTRQQGDPHFPPKYSTLSTSYATIFRQEGVRRGLYGGFSAAMLGSFPGTVIFFGTYEYTKRRMLDAGLNPSISYLTGGFLADLAASIIYVPSEVLKTRLQLQGRYNNPFFHSGYNYRSTWDAAKTISRVEGFSALFSGYKATIVRDLPFSALQFAIYEQERNMAQKWVGRGNDIGLGLEVLTAASAGTIAGTLTCPLDVVKTRTQTQVNPTIPMPELPATQPSKSTDRHGTSRKNRPVSPSIKQQQIRHFHASSGSVKPGSSILDTSSVLTGLKIIYQTEGIAGLFRGVGPRAVWTSVQSGTMLVLYQYLLKQMEHLGRLKDDGAQV